MDMAYVVSEVKDIFTSRYRHLAEMISDNPPSGETFSEDTLTV